MPERRTGGGPGASPLARREARFAWSLATPAVAVVLLVAIFPLGWTVWESLHVHDLRMPWRGRPFVGLANYAEALATPRFWQALGHTAFFAAVSVLLELLLGLALALALHRAFRGRGLVRAAVLVPWALPTVVAALLWRFLFAAEGGPLAAALGRLLGPLLGAGGGAGGGPDALVWLADPHLAWVPLILADVWKTTPFVTLLLLAGLQGIDPTLFEAARIDGAGRWRTLRHVTLPLLRPALLVALVFRTLDAFRVFDLVYVLTGGGPGTATEPIALYTFAALLQNLRFGYGSALSVLVFALTFALALLYVRLLGRDLARGPA